MVHTIHSLCFYALKALGKLPEVFASELFDLESFDRADKKPNWRDFNELVSVFLSLSDQEIRAVIVEPDNIFLDEYQDLSETLLSVVQRLVTVFNVELLYIAGDRLQNIYNQDNEDDSNNYYDRISNIFGKKIDETIHLRTNHRVKNKKILDLLNTFILSNGNTEADLYKDCQDVYKTKPVFRICDHQRSELEFVLKAIKRYGRGKNVVILSAHKTDLVIYRNNEAELSKYTGSLGISTIHSYKGLGADVVFIVGFQFRDMWNEDRGIKQFNINYVGISRAQQKLFITTSYPMSKEWVVKEFGETVDVTDKQSVNNVRLYKKLKSLRDKKYYLIDNMNNSNIDSIIFRVSKMNAPYYPYFKNAKINEKNKQNYNFKRNTIINIQGIKVTISFHYAHKGYYFKITDLNKLKMNGYTDLEILYFCRNIIREFFDFRIADSDIDLFRLDLSRFYKLDEFEQVLSGLNLENLNNLNIKDHEGSSVSNIEESVRAGKSVYLNFHKNKGLVIVIYKPDNKQNKNRIPNGNIFKVEFRYLKPQVLERKYALGTLKLSELIAELKANENFLAEVPFVTIKHKSK